MVVARQPPHPPSRIARIYRRWRSQRFEELHRPGADRHHPAQRRGRRPDRARVPVRRAARHRQDLHGAHPGQGHQLHRARRRWRAVRPLPGLRLHPRGARDGRHRDRRRQPRAGRGCPRPGDAGAHRAGRAAAAGLHHRRGPHAQRARLQRAAEAGRGAAAARRLHPRHHRHAQGAGHRSSAAPSASTSAASRRR